MKKDKLIGIFLCVTTISIGVGTTAFASGTTKTLKAFFNNIKIYLDGKKVETKSEPFIVDGVTYLPVRDIAEALDLEVSWDNKNNTIEITSKDYDNFIGKEKAKEIALKHADVKSYEVKNLKINLDRDDEHYEIKFTVDNIDYEYEIDAVTGKILSYDEDYNDNNPSDSYISQDKAKSIAFKHANVKSYEVKNLKINLDRDDEHYDIEFTVNNIEYEYEINAITGKILSYDKDYDNSNNSSNSYISQDKAKSIAFKHANVGSSSVKNIKIELDTEDGKAVYKVEFSSNAFEYEYEIDARSGKIIDYEKDEIDD